MQVCKTHTRWYLKWYQRVSPLPSPLAAPAPHYSSLSPNCGRHQAGDASALVLRIIRPFLIFSPSVLIIITCSVGGIRYVLVLRIVLLQHLLCLSILLSITFPVYGIRCAGFYPRPAPKAICSFCKSGHWCSSCLAKYILPLSCPDLFMRHIKI